MKVLRRTGGALLWVVAVFGALSGALFLAHLAGWVQPLVVVSGSMQPEIRQGDLLIAVPVAVADVDVGEVTTSAQRHHGQSGHPPGHRHLT